MNIEHLKKTDPFVAEQIEKEFERQQKTAREQLYGDRLWQNQDSSAFSARSDMSVQRGATPNTSYTKDFEVIQGNAISSVGRTTDSSSCRIT